MKTNETQSVRVKNIPGDAQMNKPARVALVVEENGFDKVIKTMKSETKHTAGPWTIWEMGHDINICTAQEESRGLGRTPIATVDCRGTVQAEANAHLIAAAPELLEACKAAYSALPPKSRPAQKLAEAISKAEGK